MAFNTPIRASLQGSSPSLGFWLMLPSDAVAKSVLLSASDRPSKFSWVLIDAEHGFITDRDYYTLSNVVSSAGASPIIRVPAAEEWMIKRALDAGAHGICTPMCHNETDAAKIASFAKYPPLGVRGYGPEFAAHTFTGIMPESQYDEGIQSTVLVIVQIESRQGVENVEKIAQVDGIDVLLIGPFDLSKQMGVQRGGKEHEAAIQRILAAAKAAGKKAAIYCTDGHDAKMRADQGFDMVSINNDVEALKKGMAIELDAVTGKTA